MCPMLIIIFHFFHTVSPIIKQNVSSTFFGVNGSFALLPCVAEGSPKPQITWLRRGGGLDINDEKYQVSIKIKIYISIYLDTGNTLK